jgi:hypothetical protein
MPVSMYPVSIPTFIQLGGLNAASPPPSGRGGTPNAGAITGEPDPSSPPAAVGTAIAAAAVASPVFTDGCFSRGKR